MPAATSDAQYASIASAAAMSGANEPLIALLTSAAGGRKLQQATNADVINELTTVWWPYK